MKTRKNSSKIISALDEKAQAAATFWDFLFLLEKLELYGADKHLMPHSGPGTDNGAEYIQKFGKSDT